MNNTKGKRLVCANHDCFGYRRVRNDEYCKVLDVNSCVRCKFYKTWDRYRADQAKSEIRRYRLGRLKK